MKLNKLVVRSQKGSLVTFLLVLGIIGITLITGVISLELLIRWVSLGRIQHAAQEAAVTYAKSMHRLRHNQMSQHNVQAIDYTYAGLALPATSTPISGALASVKGAKDLEYTQASQVLLSNIWGTRITDSSLVDNVEQQQCYKTQEESRFNKNAMSPRNNCEGGVGKVSSPIMSLRWNFQSSAYGYGVCCPLGNNDANKDFCVDVRVHGRMDPVMAGGLPFLHNIDFIKDGNFDIHARTVVMKMAAGASASSSEDIVAEQIPPSTVTCQRNSPGIPSVPQLKPAQVEALIQENCYHPEFGIIHDGVAILGNVNTNCHPERYSSNERTPVCIPGSPGCPQGGSSNDPDDPRGETPRENPVCEQINFNEQYYLDKYPDVAELVRKGEIASGLEHFTKFGQKEGREGSSCCSGMKCIICVPGSPGCCLGSQTKHMTTGGPICCENTEQFDEATGKCVKCKPNETYDTVTKRCIICVPGSPGCCLAGEYMVPGVNPPKCCPTNMTIIDTTGECKPCPEGTMPNPSTGKCEPSCKEGMPNWNPQTRTCTPPTTGGCPQGQSMNPQTNTCEPDTPLSCVQKFNSGAARESSTEMYLYCVDGCGCCRGGSAGECATYYGYNSPLILSLSNKAKITVEAKTSFSFDGKNIVKTYWPTGSSEYGFIAIDLNKNNKIDNGTELFGNHTNKKEYANGFEALAELKDKNKDNLITGKELDNLLLWKDFNGNGKSEENELLPIKSLGITQLDAGKFLTEEKIMFGENAYALPSSEKGFIRKQKSGQSVGKVYDIWLKESL